MFDDSFLTGIEEIDRQHQNLISLTEEARESLTQNPTPVKVKQVIRELLSYAIYHFRTEESLMRQYGYAEDTGNAEAHIEEHRQFAARIVAAQETLQDSNYVDTDDLLDFLGDWIARHVLSTDQELARFILRKRSKPSSRYPTAG